MLEAKIRIRTSMGRGKKKWPDASEIQPARASFFYIAIAGTMDMYLQ
jgi:hypothetical protein